MKIKHIAFAALTALAALAADGALAKDHGSDDWASFDDPAQYMMMMTRSRAEVIAEVEIWRRSGLAQLDNREDPEAFSQQYRVAMARYRAMHASPAFAARVQAIARERGEFPASTADSGR